VNKEDSQEVSGAPVNDETGIAVLSEAQLATFDAILSTVPEADDEAVGRMLATIAAARSVEDLDAPWHGQKARELIGVPLSIATIQQMPSDFEGGPGVYFVVRSTRMDTGADATFTTGAVMILWQLLTAWAIETANPGTVFPISATIREARKARPGRNPAMHLEILR
jgi:hypothetical protein